MNNEEQTLVLRDNARQQLQQIKDVEGGSEYLNKVKAIEVWVKAEKKDAELQNMVAEQKIRTQRILGQLIKKGQEAREIASQNIGGANISNGVPGRDTVKTLSEIGITRKESSVFQAIASIPEQTFEEAIIVKKQAVNKAVGELTTAGMLQVAKEIKKEQQQKIYEIRQIPEGIFDLIYCDPPWKYDFTETNNRKIENQYPTMSVNEICDMELPGIADNALLLMWATAPKLREALTVIDVWGFEYKTHGIWNKEKIGMGYWFRGQHELFLVAIKGKFSPPIPENRNPSVYEESRNTHSTKPAHYYEWIERAFPLAHKIELFARNKRDGWEAWGNE